MNAVFGTRRLSEWLALAICVFAAGCATQQAPTHFEVWKSSTNECYAVYRHEWADHVFTTATSGVPFQIVRLMPGALESVAAAEAGADKKPEAGKAGKETAQKNVAQVAEQKPVPALASAVKTEQKSSDASSQTTDSDTMAGTVTKVQSAKSRANTYGGTERTEVQAPSEAVASSASAGQVASVRSGTAKSKTQLATASTALQ